MEEEESIHLEFEVSSELLELLDIISITVIQVRATNNQTLYKVTVGHKEACVTYGRGGKHQLGACSKFQGTS